MAYLVARGYGLRRRRLQVLKEPHALPRMAQRHAEVQARRVLEGVEAPTPPCHAVSLIPSTRSRDDTHHRREDTAPGVGEEASQARPARRMPRMT